MAQATGEKIQAAGERAFQKILDVTDSLNPDHKQGAKSMTVGEISPKKRKVILVLSPHEFDRLEYMPEGSELLLNESIHLLVSSYVTTSELEEKLDNSGLLEPGTLLIQSPYNPSEYARLDQASSTFALAKYIHFTTLCGFLGAKEVTAIHIEGKSSTASQTVKVSLKNPCVDGNIKTDNRIVKEILNKIQLNSQFGGSDPDLEAAEAHLRQHQLLNDISMKSLIDQRKGQNPIKSRELTLSLSEESKRNLKVVTDIKVPMYADLQAQIDYVKKEVYEFTLAIRVEF